MPPTMKIYKWTSQFMKSYGIYDYEAANKLSAEGWIMKQTEIKYNASQGRVCCYTLWEKEVSK